MTAPGWPVRLQYGELTLRPISWRDAAQLAELWERNRQWFEPWEGTSPRGPVDHPRNWRRTAILRRRAARRGEELPWVIVWRGKLAGLLAVSSIMRGAVCAASAGYWLDQALAGQGIVPTALALAFDHVVGPVGLHRLELAIQPTNQPSLRVAAKLGFRSEGLRRGFIYVRGQWVDHQVFALTAEDVPEGLLNRWLATGGRST
ncbi:MAG: GNAT family N-acetyltransferase [Bifidobacteriaceae bacterium]|jgi:ribosomal-protein-alanine N-acetyltransferase|nr:GNAT family N-acetyltransferase [Bifidobacteriaceae bacterium]